MKQTTLEELEEAKEELLLAERSISLARSQNSQRCPQQFATIAAGPSTMLANAACASRRVATFAKCKVMCWQSASAAKILQLLLVVLEVLEEGEDTRSRLDSRDQNCCRTGRKPRQEEELRRACLRRCWQPTQELF